MNDFESGFNNTFGSIMRMQSLKEELALARLKREEYQTTSGYRSRMAELEEKRLNQELITSQTANKLNEFNIASAQARQPLELEALNANIAQSKALTESTKESIKTSEDQRKYNQDVARPLQEALVNTQIDGAKASTDYTKANTRQTEVETQSRQMGVAAQMGKNAGSVGTEVTIDDINAMAAKMVQTQSDLGFKMTPIHQSIFAQQIQQGVFAAQQELSDHKRVNAEYELRSDIALGNELLKASGGNQEAADSLLSAFPDKPRVKQFVLGGISGIAKQAAEMKQAALIEQVNQRDPYMKQLAENRTVYESQIAAGEGSKDAAKIATAKKAKTQLEALEKNASKYIREKYNINPDGSPLSETPKTDKTLSRIDPAKLSELPTDWYTWNEEQLKIAAGRLGINLLDLIRTKEQLLKTRGK